ncbi:MAG: NAD-dependent epimerase/dehydratase family protein [Trebonia sp.]
MKVFITGCSGYIGRPTIKALRAAGHDVTALARRPLHRRRRQPPHAGSRERPRAALCPRADRARGIGLRGRQRAVPDVRGSRGRAERGRRPRRQDRLDRHRGSAREVGTDRRRVRPRPAGERCQGAS